MAFARAVRKGHRGTSRRQEERGPRRWEKAIPDVRLLVIESPYRAFLAPMVAYVGSLQRSEPEVPIAVVLPSFVTRHWWERLLHNRDVARLKPHLSRQPGVRVIDFPYRLED
jgi:hypothetical protein